MTTVVTAAALAEQYIAIFNEADATRRGEIIAATWSTEGVFVDPSFEVRGHDNLSAMVDDVQQLFPGHLFRLTGDIDAHHDRLRWRWELAAQGQPPIAGGTDCATVDADGKLREVVGFFDFAPAP